MRLKGTFVFLGIDTFKGRTQPEKEYKSACFLQGTETLKVFLDDVSVSLLTGTQPMETLECDLDVKIGQKTYVSLTAVKKLQSKVA